MVEAPEVKQNSWGTFTQRRTQSTPRNSQKRLSPETKKLIQVFPKKNMFAKNGAAESDSSFSTLFQKMSHFGRNARCKRDFSLKFSWGVSRRFKVRAHQYPSQHRSWATNTCSCLKWCVVFFCLATNKKQPLTALDKQRWLLVPWGIFSKKNSTEQLWKSSLDPYKTLKNLLKMIEHQKTFKNPFISKGHLAKTFFSTKWPSKSSSSAKKRKTSTAQLTFLRSPSSSCFRMFSQTTG